MLVIIALFTAAGCALVSGIGVFSGDFFDIVEGLVSLLIFLLILVAIPIVKLIGKDELLKPVTIIAISYLFIYIAQYYISFGSAIVGGNDAYRTIVCIFTLIAGLALVVAFVFYVISIFTKGDAFKNIIAFILVGFLALAATLFIMWIIGAIVWGFDWTFYFTVVMDYLAIPCAVVCAVLPALVKD